MQTGGIIVVFGLLLLGRGLLDVLRSEAVAAANRQRNSRVSSGSGGVPATFAERRQRHAESPAEVRRQGKNVLWFSLATLVTGIVVMALSP